ncbi:MAG: TIGR03936 family radical SAM-associated protein [Peptococcaceae bacterium]|nr:TIGR03936 family radical SAM-associated protein [Peptococcaceae bacterium]
MKLRICYEKTEAGRFLSHLDLARTMERSLRRAGIPLAFSEGFNPHPKMSFASALAVGITGEREYLDLELRRRINPEQTGQAIAQAMPPALKLVALREIQGPGKSLSALINRAVYALAVPAEAVPPEKVQTGIDGVLAARELWRQPKVKPGKKPIPAKEVRHLIQDLRIGTAQNSGAVPEQLLVEMTLTLNNEGQLRPQEIWQMIGEKGGFFPAKPLWVCRRALLIARDGKAFSPMEGV